MMQVPPERVDPSHGGVCKAFQESDPSRNEAILKAPAPAGLASDARTEGVKALEKTVRDGTSIPPRPQCNARRPASPQAGRQEPAASAAQRPEAPSRPRSGDRRRRRRSKARAGHGHTSASASLPPPPPPLPAFKSGAWSSCDEDGASSVSPGSSGSEGSGMECGMERAAAQRRHAPRAGADAVLRRVATAPADSLCLGATQPGRGQAPVLAPGLARVVDDASCWGGRKPPRRQALCVTTAAAAGQVVPVGIRALARAAPPPEAAAPRRSSQPRTRKSVTPMGVMDFI